VCRAVTFQFGADYAAIASQLFHFTGYKMTMHNSTVFKAIPQRQFRAPESFYRAGEPI